MENAMNFWRYLRWAGSVGVVLLLVWVLAQHPDTRVTNLEGLRPAPCFGVPQCR
jgi:hypothetical protein